MAQAPFVSAVSYVEVLGYHELSTDEEALLRQFIAISKALPIDQDVLDEAVRLRQKRKMSLGDAFVAATALVNNLASLTHNLGDFEWIEGLVVIDPIEKD
jgi:predicted nucleic acid-binding protein